MATEVTVEQDGEGRLVVRKVSLPDDRGDLREEASWLRRASGCGAVEVVSTSDDPPTLVTLHAGSHTWRTSSPDPDTAAVLLASALRTVSLLHRRGLVHGALTADHLIVAGRRVVLCSPRSGSPDPAEDRSALAQLMADTAHRWRTSAPPVPPPAGWERAAERLGRPASGWTLDDVADQLDGRGERTEAAGPASARSSDRDGSQFRPGIVVPSRRWAVAGIAAVVLLVPVALLAVTRAGPGPVPGRVGTGPGVDLAGARYRATGLAGVLTATDRPCPGSPAAALLEPQSGVVWAFVDLPDSRAGVPGVAVAQVPGASRVVAVEGGGCRRLVVQGPAGQAELRSP